MNRIVVIGSANVDFTVRVARLPRPGETLLGSDLAIAFGGKGANQAIAAARLGGNVSFIGKLGNDDLGARYLEHLRTANIDVTGVARCPDAPTGSAMITVEESGGQNMIVVSPGANLRLSPSDLEEQRGVIAGASIIMLQMEIPQDTVLCAMRLAGEAGADVILNPSPLPESFAWTEAHAAYVIVNSEEAIMVAGVVDTESAPLVEMARRLLRFDIGNIVVTRGARDTFLLTRASTHPVPTFPVTPVDTVGAGDTFAGAFAAALCEGMEPSEAIRFANCAAALATLRPGAQTAMPTRAEVFAHLGAG